MKLFILQNLNTYGTDLIGIFDDVGKAKEAAEKLADKQRWPLEKFWHKSEVKRSHLLWWRGDLRPDRGGDYPRYEIIKGGKLNP